MAVIESIDVHKTYNPETIPVRAVDGISVSFDAGEFTAIVGPSGCGKTTFLNLIGGLEKPTQGKVLIDEKDISKLSIREMTDYRLHNIGFVFQAYNLIPVMSAYENVAFIMQLLKFTKKDIAERVEYLLRTMSVWDKRDERPNTLSGGQQQRVAVARALASKPKFILADEPTANLDSKSTGTLLDLMHHINETENTTIIFSTHDDRVMERARRLIQLDDGKIVKDEHKGA
ncbi:MAG: ABC transporter ATP-binding protein [Bacteroidetes bacterium]|nr:MAG: ABC transporter ATP-binding protein [Bacteroidota bacterium]